MLDYTYVAYNKTRQDITNLITLISVLSQVLYIGYLILMLFVGGGLWYINLALLIISSVYFIFWIFMHNRLENVIDIDNKSERRSAKRKQTLGKRIYKYTKYVIQVFTVGVSLTNIILYPESVHPIVLIFTAFMPVILILSILIEIISLVVMDRVHFFYEAIKADIETIKQPVDKVKDIYNKIMNKPKEPEPERTKHRVTLDEMVSEKKKHDKARKDERKAAKEDKRIPISALLSSLRRRSKDTVVLDSSDAVITDELPSPQDDKTTV